MAPARRHPALHGLCPGRNFDSYSPAAGTPHSIPVVGSDRRKPPGSVGMDQSNASREGTKLVLSLEGQGLFLHGLYEFRRHARTWSASRFDDGPPFRSGGIWDGPVSLAGMPGKMSRFQPDAGVPLLFEGDLGTHHAIGVR